jgi:hypothetical protein
MYTCLNSDCTKIRKNVSHLTTSPARGYFVIIHSSGQLLQSWIDLASAAPKARQPLIFVHVSDNRNELETLV